MVVQKKCYFKFLFLVPICINNLATCFQEEKLNDLFPLDTGQPMPNSAPVVETERTLNSFFENFSVDHYKAPSRECEGKVCVSKCCGSDSIFSMASVKCVGIASTNYTNITEWRPEIYTKIGPSKLLILHGLPNISQLPFEIGCFLHDEDSFYLQENGRIFSKERKESISQEFYCIEKMIESDGKTSVSGVICYPPTQMTQFEILLDNCILIGLYISCCFLVLILVIHLISNHRKDLPSKSLISSCINLVFAFILLIVNKSSAVLPDENASCVALALGMQFFFLSFFFWLNTMCYETSRVIRGTVSTIPLNLLQGTNGRYLRYSLYAWGCPFVICSFTCAMQNLPKNLPSEIEPYIIRPNMADGRCWFEEKSGSVFAYYYSVEIILHVANAFMLGHSAYLLSREKVALQNHSRSDNIKIFWQQFSIFIVYVFIWSFNCFSLIYSSQQFWRIVDFVVSLQGAYLFFIVIKTKRHLVTSPNYERFFDMAKEFSFKVSLKKKKSNSNFEVNSSISQNEEISL